MCLISLRILQLMLAEQSMTVKYGVVHHNFFMIPFASFFAHMFELCGYTITIDPLYNFEQCMQECMGIYCISQQAQALEVLHAQCRSPLPGRLAEAPGTYPHAGISIRNCLFRGDLEIFRGGFSLTKMPAQIELKTKRNLFSSHFSHVQTSLAST